jgi:hypothetical protein
MYIRRKVFSSFIDEYGEERYFSTTEFEDERLYAEHPFKPGVFVTAKERKELIEAEAKKKGYKDSKEMLTYLNRQDVNDMLSEGREKAAKEAEIEATKRAAQKAERRANQATYEELAKKEAAKKKAEEKAKRAAERKAEYEKSLKGRANKAGGWVKKAWNGEVGKLGKTGNRVAMIGAPVVAAGATYGAVKGAQAIKNRRAALTDED